MPSHLPLLLVTGFEPFGGSPLNPSAMIAEQLSAPSGWAIDKRILPVDTTLLSSHLETLFKGQRPSLVLSLGEARGSASFRIETTARNRLAFRLPDNAGRQIDNEAILSEGPAKLSTTLAIDLALKSLRRHGFEAELSHDAGGFLCNQLFYSLCHRFSGSQTRVGFLHVPSLPEQNFGPGLELGRQVNAVQRLLDELTTRL